MSDLEQIITDSVNDSINEVTVDDTPEVDASPEPVEASESAPEAEPVAEEPSSPEVSSPAAVEAAEATPAEPQDEFAKLAGMPQMGVGGRENRIPYSRVKKITEKAVGEVAEAVLGRKLNPGEKAVDVVKAHVAKLPELETKVTDYESRLESVGRFEHVMANDPEQFLQMLSKLPAYSEFFAFVDKAVAQAQNPQGQSVAQPTAEQSAVSDEMPEPDEELSDGSRVYSMEGLKALLAWNAKQVESRVAGKYENEIKEIRSQFGPVANAWQEQQRREAVLPTIRKQLEDAHTWPLFNESEEEILNVLRNDKQISLEGAYRQVVFPKLVAERNKVRQDVIREVQAAPVATSVAARTASKPASTNPGPRSIEDVIRDSVATLKK